MEKLHDIENMESIKKTWEKLEKNTLDYVFNILKTHAFIDHTKEINSVYALIPIILYVYRKNVASLSELEIKKITKWFYYSQIRNRYISQLPQKLDKDLGIVSNENNPFDKLLNIIEADRRLEIHPDEFIGVGVLNPLWSLMKWYFKSQNAVCLTTGISIKGNPMGKKYSLEWDHIFPFSVLSKNGYDWGNRHKYSLAQEITNRAVLTQVANRTKSNKNADDYLAEVKSKYPKALRLQCIPTDEILWELNNYELFLHERRKLLAKSLNNFLDKITETSDEPMSMEVGDLIQQGENSSLELKTTLRWDLKAEKVNTKLEEVILKTIAAFSNAEGGTLIIGVKDDLTIEGLHYDYASLSGDKDKFEIHLRNILNSEYGVEYSTNNLNITFPEVDEKEICLIQIKSGNKPLYTTIKDSSGVKSKKFFVRSGNSSQEVPIHEIHEYLSKRF